MRIEIREASKDDMGRLIPLVCEFRNEHSTMLRGKSTFTINDAEEEVKRYMEAENTGYFVAVGSQSQLIGFRRWELHDEFYFTRELYVISSMRQQGIAKQLIRHFEIWGLGKGQDIACISCTPQNVAMIMLARSEGYQILNMIEMRKELTAKADKPRSQAEALGLKWNIL